MGYYADGSGTLTLNCKYKDIPNDIANAFGCAFDWVEPYNDTEVSIGCSEKYYEDEVLHALDSVIPYLKEGYISYSGEDDAHWMFEFNTETREWEEHDAVICYSALDYCSIPGEKEFLENAIKAAVKTDRERQFAEDLLGYPFEKKQEKVS